MIELSPLLLIPIALVVVSGWLLYINAYTDRKRWLPEAPELIKARKTHSPILCITDAGTGNSTLQCAVKKHKTDYVFDLKDLHTHIPIDFNTAATAPIKLYGDIPVFFCSTTLPSVLGVENIIALNNLEAIYLNPQFAKLRFLSNQDLHGLMKCPSTDIVHDCEVFYATYAADNISQQYLPDTLEQFIDLIYEAKEQFDKMPLYDPASLSNDCLYFGTIIEPLPAPSATQTVKHWWNRHQTPEEPAPDQICETSSKLAYRTPIAIRMYSVKYAFQTISTAMLSQDVDKLIGLVQTQARMQNRDEANRYLIIGLAGLLILMGAGIAFTMITNTGGGGFA